MRSAPGAARFCVAYGDHDLWNAILGPVASGVAPPSSAPPNVEVVRRVGNGKSVEPVINHNRETVEYGGRTLAPLEVVVR